MYITVKPETRDTKLIATVRRRQIKIFLSTFYLVEIRSAIILSF